MRWFLIADYGTQAHEGQEGSRGQDKHDLSKQLLDRQEVVRRPPGRESCLIIEVLRIEGLRYLVAVQTFSSPLAPRSGRRGISGIHAESPLSDHMTSINTASHASHFAIDVASRIPTSLQQEPHRYRLYCISRHVRCRKRIGQHT
jgi:hypothetical protein